MRVLMLSWEYPPYMVGGLGKHVLELATRLVDLGVEIHLVTPRIKGGTEEEPIISAATGQPAANGSRIYRVDTGFEADGNFHNNVAYANIALGNAAKNIMGRVGAFDLIHAHDWLVSFAAIGLKQHLRMPLLSTIHATEMGRNRGHLNDTMQQDIHRAEWRLVYESWRVIACSNFMAWEMQTYFGAAQQKIDVIYNGVDTAPFDRLSGVDLSDFRTNWAQPDEKIVFYIGRLVWEKGLHVLVDAAPEIIAKIPGVKFIVAGGGSFRHELAWRARSRGVAGWFNFPGRISDDDRDRIYKVADCAVFPSLYEPFGIVALEGMAAGCPVVVSDVGGLAEVVDLHHTGLKVHADDPASLAWGILHTLQHPDWARARAENAYRVAKTLFNWERVAQFTTQTYGRIVAEALQNEWAYFGRRRGSNASPLDSFSLEAEESGPAVGDGVAPLPEAEPVTVGASNSDPSAFDPRLER